MTKNNNKFERKEKKKLKRIPAKFLIPGVALTGVIIFLVAWFFISLSSHTGNTKSLLYDKLGVSDVSIVKANKTGVLNQDTEDTSDDLKFSYTTNVKGINVGAYALEYKNATSNSTGTLKFKLGFKLSESNVDVTVNSCKTVLCDGWGKYVSSSSTVSSSFYSTSKITTDSFYFYSSSKSLTIAAGNIYPVTYMGFLHKVSAPTLYVYLNYTLNSSTTKEIIVSFTYSQYFISGQSTGGING